MITSYIKPIGFRGVVLMLVVAVNLLSGCSKKPSEERAVDSAARRYSRIGAGMSKSEVVASLGEPSSRQGSSYRWETVAGPQSSASIEVQFDGAGKVMKTSKSHATRD